MSCFSSKLLNFIVEKNKHYNNTIMNKRYDEVKYCNKNTKKSLYFFPWKANDKSKRVHFFLIGKLIKFSLQ